MVEAPQRSAYTRIDADFGENSNACCARWPLKNGLTSSLISEREIAAPPERPRRLLVATRKTALARNYLGIDPLPMRRTWIAVCAGLELGPFASENIPYGCVAKRTPERLHTKSRTSSKPFHKANLSFASFIVLQIASEGETQKAELKFAKILIANRTNSQKIGIVHCQFPSRF